MTISQISATRIVGISSAVPQYTQTVADDAIAFGSEEAHKISKSIGIRSRHVVSENMCTSDLCQAAAERLLTDLKWSRESVDAVIFVSQTPDYILPATSCALHGRMGLSKQCAAFDLSLGCSGYVYGLLMAGLSISNGGMKRVLLLAGDTISRIVSPRDRSTTPLFGDAGTATALEYAPSASQMTFVLGTDGSGSNKLIVPAGGFRNPSSPLTAQRTVRENGNIRSDDELFMDGTEIFAFTLREVPRLIRRTLAEAGWESDSIDAYVFHQANEFMLKHLAKRLRIPENKLILAMEGFGNTSSASVPLALTHALRGALSTNPKRLILAGFGVGLSWGAVSITMGPIVIPDLFYLADNHRIERTEA